MAITLIIENRNVIAYAKNKREAKKMIMDKLEEHPEWYNGVEDWWNNTSWNVKQVYRFETVKNQL